MLNINSFLDIKIYPSYPRKIILSWDIVSKDLPFPIAADIYRSGSESGEWEKLNFRPVTATFFEDDGLKPLSKLFDLVYKIVFKLPHTSEVTEIGPLYIATNTRLKKAFLVARRMDQKHYIEYRSHTGVELLIFKRKHWGEKCSYCFDPITNDSIRSNCDSCFGTSFEGGFWKPVHVLGKIEPFDKTQRLEGPFGFSENLTSQAHLRAFPIVKKGDILVEKLSNNRHYINSVRLVEHNRFPVKQLAEIRTIERSSPLYRLEDEE